MPGTIQVSILELAGLPSSKSSSSTSIKVSLGKHSYEAEGDKADFLLPLATLRDNLVVKVRDNEGNEIAHTGVKSRLIAEKGSWDDLFPLEGGGHVHMRLKFSLSEEERNRIRNMRESALRKKQEELLNKNKRDLQAIVASSGGENEMASTAAISNKAQSFDLPLEASSKVVTSKPNSIASNSFASLQVKEDDPHKLKEQNSLEEKPSRLQEDDQPYNFKEQSPLEKTPIKLQEHDHPYSLEEQIPPEKPLSRLKEDDQPYNSKEQSPMEKTPSKFKEYAQPYNLKEQIPLVKMPSKLKEDNQPYNLKEQNCFLEKTPSKVRETIAAFESSCLTQGLMTTAKEQSGREMTYASPKEEASYEPKDVHTKEYKSKEISDEKNPKGEYPLHYIFESEKRGSSKELQRSSNMEQYKISEDSQPSNSVTEQEYACGDKMNAEVFGRRRRCSCRNFNGWIFLEEAICSCIVSDNRVVIDLLGNYSVNPKTYPGKLVGEEVGSSIDDKLSGITKKPDTSPSSGDSSSKGPNGQVMKIVIMVGFGLLVLFTRKRKSR